MEIKDNLKTGDTIDAQLCIYGDVPNTALDGEEVVQKFTRDAFEKLIANWRENGAKPIRVDLDHSSEITDKTEAAGWIEDLWTADDGLYGKITISELGAEKLNGLNYRYGSPAFVLDEDGEPVEMTSFALTNRPRMEELKPVWNCAEKNSETSLNAEVRVNTQNETKPMEKIIELLGLPADSTEDDVLSLISGMMDKLGEITKKEAEDEQAAAEEKLEEEATEALDGCDVSEEDKEKVVDFYKKNPDTARLLVNAFKTKKNSLVVNFDEAKKPDVKEITDFQKQLDALPGGQARVDFILNYSKSKH